MSSPDDSVTAIWSSALAELEASPDMTPRQLAFIKLAHPLALVEGNMILAVANEWTRDYLESRVRLELTQALVNATERDDARFAITVDTTLDDGAEAAHLRQAKPSTGQVPVVPPAGAPPQAAPTQLISESDVFNPNRRPSSNPSSFEPTSLNAHYIFETFVIGASNRFAHAAAVAVAEAPAKAYNPLFIYGDSGLGKTHLLHAIGHYAQSLYPGVRVRYVNSEEFTNDFINSIGEGKAGAFQRRYREVDVLLIDDIQFLQGKAETQEAFFHTFNTLHDHDKQVVITSDVPPRHLTGFEDRMRSRFEWGLITDVQAPDLETRIAILRKKAQSERLLVPDEVLEYIATKVSSNIRELEGALIRVSAFASLNRSNLDISLAQTVLRDIVDTDDANVIMPTDIIAATAQYFRLSVDDLYGSSRSQSVATARQIAMYLCRERTNLSLPKIGQLFGNRDHTTVMYACKKIAQLMKERRSIYNQVSEITTQLGRASR